MSVGRGQWVLKKVVRYREVDEQHALVQWFWQTLDEFSNEERVLFMRFVSGRSRLPANTADISQRFQIMKVDRVSWSTGGGVKAGGLFDVGVWRCRHPSF